MSVDITYHSFNPHRADTAWAGLWECDPQSFVQNHITRNDWQNQLRKLNLKEDYLSSAKQLSEEDRKKREELEQQLQSLEAGMNEFEKNLSGQGLIYTLAGGSQRPTQYDLLSLDLHFGSIHAYITEPEWEETFLSLLFIMFLPANVTKGKYLSELYTSCQTKENFLSVFRHISINAIADYIQNSLPPNHKVWFEVGKPTPEHKKWLAEEIVKFAREIRPVIADLKTPESVFFQDVNGSSSDEPFLRERAESHMASFREHFPKFSLKTRSSI